jgi:hypothetical protein
VLAPSDLLSLKPLAVRGRADESALQIELAVGAKPVETARQPVPGCDDVRFGASFALARGTHSRPGALSHDLRLQRTVVGPDGGIPKHDIRLGLICPVGEAGPELFATAGVVSHLDRHRAGEVAAPGAGAQAPLQ